MQLKSKIGRKKNNLVVERNRVKLLGFVIVIAMNVSGHRRN